MSIKKAAEGLIQPGKKVDDGVLNMIEMAFRAYDPCLSCATHALGKMPLEISLLDSSGELLERLVKSSSGNICAPD